MGDGKGEATLLDTYTMLQLTHAAWVSKTEAWVSKTNPQKDSGSMGQEESVAKYSDRIKMNLFSCCNAAKTFYVVNKCFAVQQSHEL